MWHESLKVNIASDLEEVHFKHILQNQSESATSSLNRDIISGRQNELETSLDNYLNQHQAVA